MYILEYYKYNNKQFCERLFFDDIKEYERVKNGLMKLKHITIKGNKNECNA